MTEFAVKGSALSKRFGGSASNALEDLDLSIKSGEILALLGPSGSGKTTVLRIVAGFETPDTGTLEIAGRQVAGPDRFVPPDRRRVGMVFQEYALFPHLTVSGNVGFGISDRSVRKQLVEQALTIVGLTDLAHRLPHELSGGQQQRVSLARALCPHPAVLLLDEPFSNLDEALRKFVRREVRDILRFTQSTALFVTHDQDEAMFMGDQVAIMDQGKLQQVGTPEEVYQTPATRFVAEFLGVGDFLPVRFYQGRLQTEVGEIEWSGEPPPEDSHVLLRPDDMTLEPSETGRGMIMERVFLGPTYLYDVAMLSGRSIRVMQHHTRVFNVGTLVDVSILARHDLPLFLGEQRVA